jgi:O-antigen/teichoic acid export membrane protein
MIKSIIRESLVYGFSSLLVGLTRIALLPLYTKTFSPEDYGLIALINSITLLLSIMMSLSIETAYSKHYHQTSNKVQFLSSLVNFRILFGLLVLLLFILLSIITINVGNINVDIFLLITSGIIVYFTGISDLLALYLRMNHKPWTFLLNSALNAACTALCIIIAVYSSPTIQYYYFGQLIASVCGILIIYTVIRRLVRIRIFEMFNIRTIHTALSFSLSLVPASLATIVNTNATKWILSTLSTQQVGIFEYGNNISSIFVMLNSIVRTTFLPYSMKIITYDNYNASKLLRNLSNLYIYAFLIAWAFFTQVSSFIARLFAPDQFQDANQIIEILSLTNIIYTLTMFSTLGSWHVNKSIDTSIAILCGTITNIILSLLLSPIYGIVGAATATLVSNIVIVILSFYLSNIRHSFHYMYWHIIAQITISIIYLYFVTFNTSIGYFLGFCIISTTLYCFSRIYEKHYHTYDQHITST